MGMIARYVERLVARLQGRHPGPPAVSADGSGLAVGGATLAWRDIRRVQAYKRDAYVGDCFCLAFEVKGNGVVVVTEGSPGWDALGVAVAQFLPGAMAPQAWGVRLMAAAPGESVTVYTAD